MLRELRIGDMVAKLPIIQGGMGVGVSLSRLAGAVAKEGGVGVISTAQIGFEEPEFEKDQAKANLIAIKKHIKKAKELACGHGMVGVNIMVALKHYKEHVLAAVEAGADVIISGAASPHIFDTFPNMCLSMFTRFMSYTSIVPYSNFAALISLIA